MLNFCFAFPAIIQFTALGAFGFACIILVCFGLSVELIIDAYKNPEKRLKKGQRREWLINKVTYWDYLIVILPLWLFLIVLFSNDYGDRTFSMVALGIGYSGLILSPYNRRIDIPKIKWTIYCVSVLLAVMAIVILYFSTSDLSNVRETNLLFAPLAAYVYLIISRQIIKMLYGTYPITLDRYYSVREFHERYDRKTNYWDATWSLVNIIVLVGILIFCF